jgi:hypothetical protein
MRICNNCRRPIDAERRLYCSPSCGSAFRARLNRAEKAARPITPPRSPGFRPRGAGQPDAEWAEAIVAAYELFPSLKETWDTNMIDGCARPIVEGLTRRIRRLAP